MTFDGRLNHLERVLGGKDDKPRPALVVYDPRQAPGERQPDTGTVFFIPDNGRNG